MLAGAYFPVVAFPHFLQILAGFLPYTWGYDLIRYYSFNGRWDPLLPLWLEWAIILVHAVVYLVLSHVLLHQVERQARRDGLHLI